MQSSPQSVAQDPGTPSASGVIVVVDDDRSNLTSLEKILSREGYTVHTAASARDALALCRKERAQVLLTDLMMPGMSGLELMQALKTSSPETETIMMTAYGTIETAVQAMREGAYDFIEKPLNRLHVVRAVRKALEKQALVQENQRLRDQLSALSDTTLVGSSPVWRRTVELAAQAAPSSATILLLGESGTGKEVIARFVHKQSGVTGAFVAVNLAALPETIVEAELFGYERGAFTGATTKREGRLAQAEGGTLFLDEIGELPLSLQVKLLRVLQEGEYEPLGGSTRKARFRLIAATNRDLQQAISQGQFREDLFYRLNVIAITNPPLRSRREDIPLLAQHFIQMYCGKNSKPIKQLSAEARQALMRYTWPGNVRELENAIERAVVLSRADTISENDLPELVTTQPSTEEEIVHFAVGTQLTELERQAIDATLRHTRGDKQLAANILGISARTIYRKLGEPDENS